MRLTAYSAQRSGRLSGTRGRLFLIYEASHWHDQRGRLAWAGAGARGFAARAGASAAPSVARHRARGPGVRRSERPPGAHGWRDRRGARRCDARSGGHRRHGGDRFHERAPVPPPILAPRVVTARATTAVARRANHHRYATVVHLRSDGRERVSDAVADLARPRMTRTTPDGRSAAAPRSCATLRDWHVRRDARLAAADPGLHARRRRSVPAARAIREGNGPTPLAHMPPVLSFRKSKLVPVETRRSRSSRSRSMTVPTPPGRRRSPRSCWPSTCPPRSSRSAARWFAIRK